MTSSPAATRIASRHGLGCPSRTDVPPRGSVMRRILRPCTRNGLTPSRVASPLVGHAIACLRPCPRRDEEARNNVPYKGQTGLSSILLSLIALLLAAAAPALPTPIAVSVPERKE